MCWEVFSLDDHKRTLTDCFLEDVSEQISYKPLRPSIVKELNDHIEDRIEAYVDEGMSRDAAERKAVSGMGDAIAIGAELNAVRHTRFCIPLLILTAALMAGGFFIAVYMQLLPEQQANGFLYYIPGIALLALVTFIGYPWLIRYQTRLVRLMILLYGIEFLWELLLLWNPRLYSIPVMNHYVPYHMIKYYATLLLAPVLVIATYRMRRKPVTALLILMAAISLFVWLRNTAMGNNLYSVTLIFIAAFMAAISYMIFRSIFQAPKRKLILVAGMGCLLSIGVFAASPSQDYHFKVFAAPEAVTNSVWDDSYNSLLIQELLSRTPATGGVSLTPAELMDYSTGRWYFESRDKTKIRWIYEPNDEILKASRDPQNPNYRNTAPVYHNESNVALWDILPQHYHNNYLIALAILQFGWVPAMCLLALPALFYTVLFTCILKIRGKLAGSVAFCCGAILLVQGILYLLGNLGFQYGTFTNLPLVSEGRISILANMLLLGFIFSAYRYDRVIEETAHANNGYHAANQ